MDKAFIIGNGLSRKSLDLNELKKTGVVFGCNAIYKEWAPDYLCVVDSAIQLEIIQSDYRSKCYFSDTIPQSKSIIPDGEEQSIFFAGLNIVSELGDKKESKQWVLLENTIIWLSSEYSHIIWIDKSTVWGVSCGMYALWIALSNGHRDIDLFGFDSLKHDDYRNVYDGHRHYQYDPNSEDGIRNPETYRPGAVEYWPKIYENLILQYPDATISMM